MNQVLLEETKATENKAKSKGNASDHFQSHIELMDQEVLANRMYQANQIAYSPLFVRPPHNVTDSYRFGWARGIVMQTETLLCGRWYNWLTIIAKGSLSLDEKIHHLILGFSIKIKR